MAVYYILLLVPLMIQHFSVRKRDINYQAKNDAALFFFFALMTVLVMLRHETVGTDTSVYTNHFFRYSNTKWSDLAQSPLEIGYSFFVKLIAVFTASPQVCFAITAIVTFAMIYPTYKRLCEDASLTIVLFCTMPIFVMMFSGIRQVLAMGIGVIAYEFTRSKKKILFSKGFRLYQTEAKYRISSAFRIYFH